MFIFSQSRVGRFPSDKKLDSALSVVRYVTVTKLGYYFLYNSTILGVFNDIWYAVAILGCEFGRVGLYEGGIPALLTNVNQMLKVQ